MNATMTMPPEVAEYLAEVRGALRDLPAAERDDLLADVEASVMEAAGEGGAIAARLGPPREFAAELRAAAGLHEPTSAAARHDAAPSLRETLARALSHPRAEQAREILRELAPIWWVARAYVAVAAYVLWTGGDWTSLHQGVPRFGTAVAGGVVIAVAIAVSVALGLLGRRRPDPIRHLRVVANVVLVLAALPVVGHLADPRYAFAATAAEPVALAPAPAGLARDGVPVDNIYPYSRDGRLMYDVLLYDGAGRPIEVRPVSEDPLRRVLVTPDGKPIFNAFPIRYYEPGTQTVARPNAAPRVELPRILTPPLTQERPTR